MVVGVGARLLMNTDTPNSADPYETFFGGENNLKSMRLANRIYQKSSKFAMISEWMEMN